MSRIRTKICGITKLADADAAVRLCADAIGLNFFPKSKRFIELSAAAEISHAHSDSVAIYGVFVDSNISSIVSHATAAKLSHIQLHGNEQPEIVKLLKTALPLVRIVRAIRIKNEDFDHAQSEIDRWIRANADQLLLDAAAPNEYGGTGNRLDWNQVSSLNLPENWLLAGGLNPTNVSEAIKLACPHGVDVASGVESSPGIKNVSKMKQFIDSAHDTLLDANNR